TSLCSPGFCNSSEYPGSVPYPNVLMPSIFGAICFFGIIGNCIVIYTIVKKTKFRAQQTVPDIFIFSLSLVDLFLLGMPFHIHQLLGNGSWCFGDIMCTVITALDSNSQIVSTYILTVITLDRYLATVHPICFNHVCTPCMKGAALGLVWVLSLGDGSVGCALLLPNPATDTYWFTLYQFVLAFALPLVIICVVFFKILQNMSATVAPLPHLLCSKLTGMILLVKKGHRPKTTHENFTILQNECLNTLKNNSNNNSIINNNKNIKMFIICQSMVVTFCVFSWICWTIRGSCAGTWVIDEWQALHPLVPNLSD
uniref:Melanin-concentrating hormone receptor 1 n=1 Tax=Hucho hucho TaxID=62062 RepID=A0A4W5QEU7_9TELE